MIVVQVHLCKRRKISTEDEERDLDQSPDLETETQPQFTVVEVPMEQRGAHQRHHITYLDEKAEPAECNFSEE